MTMCTIHLFQSVLFNQITSCIRRPFSGGDLVGEMSESKVERVLGLGFLDALFQVGEFMKMQGRGWSGEYIFYI